MPDASVQPAFGMRAVRIPTRLMSMGWPNAPAHPLPAVDVKAMSAASKREKTRSEWAPQHGVFRRGTLTLYEG